jgi:prepilin-type processing-associated H-X9-DG protein
VIVDGAWKPLSDLQRPASAIMIAENKSRYRSIYSTDFNAALKGGSGGTAARSRATGLSGDVSAGEGHFQVHAKMVNFIFADGHVKALRLSATFVPEDLWSTGASAAQLKTWSDNVRPEYR